jgi:hypothetical protein
VINFYDFHDHPKTLYGWGAPAKVDHNSSNPSYGVHEVWYRNGVQYREHGPVIVIREIDYYQEVWKENGLRHRPDGPAVIERPWAKHRSIDYHWHIEGVHVASAIASIVNDEVLPLRDVWIRREEWDRYQSRIKVPEPKIDDPAPKSWIDMRLHLG